MQMKTIALCLIGTCLLLQVRGDSLTEGLGKVGSGATGFFMDKFQDLKSLFANNQEELVKNIGRVKGLLNNILSQKGEIKENANSAQKATLNQVDNWKNDVDAFAKKVESDGESNFPRNKAAWKSKLNTMFKNGNLASLLPLMSSGANKLKMSGSVLAILVPVFVRFIFV